MGYRFVLQSVIQEAAQTAKICLCRERFVYVEMLFVEVLLGDHAQRAHPASNPSSGRSKLHFLMQRLWSTFGESKLGLNGSILCHADDSCSVGPWSHCLSRNQSFRPRDSTSCRFCLVRNAAYGVTGWRQAHLKLKFLRTSADATEDSCTECQIGQSCWWACRLRQLVMSCH